MKTNNGTTQAEGCLKVEFARRYFPGLKDASALKKLQQWIKLDPDLYDELYKAGYERLHDHHFTARQLAILKPYFEGPQNI